MCWWCWWCWAIILACCVSSCCCCCGRAAESPWACWCCCCRSCCSAAVPRDAPDMAAAGYPALFAAAQHAEKAEVQTKPPTSLKCRRAHVFCDRIT
jgi:hypothetical protein